MEEEEGEGGGVEGGVLVSDLEEVEEDGGEEGVSFSY